MGIEFGTWEAPEAVNPYDETVAILAASADENASVTISEDVNEIQKHVLQIQRAANAIGKTAKIRSRDNSGVKSNGVDDAGKDILTGPVRVTLTLTAKHKARRGAQATADESVEVPAGK